MNEDKNLQELFQPIESGVSASDTLRRRVRDHVDGRKNRRFGRKLTWASGFAVATVFVWGTLVLLPTSSVAARVKRLEAALRDVKLMRIQTYEEAKGVPRHLISEVIVANGAWRSDIFEGTPLARTYIRQSGEQWLYLACSNVAVGEPEMNRPIEGVPSALEWAKGLSDEGDIDTPREFKIAPHANEGGRPAYEITATRPGTQYHLELIVDKVTDLPIRSTMTEPGTTDETFNEEYSYDFPIGESTFNPKIKPTTKILTVSSEVARLQQKWRNSLGHVAAGKRHMDLRDVSVNSRGEVFVVCSYDKKIGSPTEGNLLPLKLTDDLGRQYEEVALFDPGATFGDTDVRNKLLIDGDFVKIAEFAPLLPKSAWQPANALKIQASTFSDNWVKPPASTDGSITIAAPAVMPTQFPDYSDSLFLGYDHLEFEMAASEIRARKLEKAGDFAQAAHWYQDAATHAPVPGFRKRELAMAKRCLDRYGKTP